MEIGDLLLDGVYHLLHSLELVQDLLMVEPALVFVPRLHEAGHHPEEIPHPLAFHTLHGPSIVHKSKVFDPFLHFPAFFCS